MSIIQKTNFKEVKRYEAFYTEGKIQVTSDGLYLLSQCGAKINVIEISTGAIKQSIAQEDDVDLTCFFLSPDNEILVTANKNLILRHWQFKELTVTRTWKSIHFAPVTVMAFDCTSTLLATGSADSTVKVWDMVRQYCTHNLRGHQGVISVAEFHPDVTNRLQLYTAADDYEIRVWSLTTSNCLSVLKGHYSVVTSIKFSLDGTTLYSGSRDSTVILWNLDDFSKHKVIPVYESVESVILLSDVDSSALLKELYSEGRQYFMVAGDKGGLRLWEANSSRNVLSTSSESADTKSQAVGKESESSHSAITSAFMIEGLSAVCTVTQDRNVLMYEKSSLKLFKQFAGHNDDILDIKYIGEKDSHIIVATNSALIKVFEVSTWSCQILTGHSDIVVSIDVLQLDNGSFFVSSSKDNTIRLWSMHPTTHQISCMAVGIGHTHTVGAVAFSKKALKFLVSSSTDLTLKLWPLDESSLLAEILSKSERKPSESSTEDEKLFNSLHQLKSSQTEKAHDKDINCIAVAPNNSYIATGSHDKTVKLWGYESNQSGSLSRLHVAGVLRGHKRGVWCVQFSCFDQLIASASADTTIRLWDIKSLACIKTLEGHESSVLRVQFLTHGMQIVSSGSDGMLKLWNVKSQECVKTIDAHEEKIWAMDVDGSENHVVTGAGDSVIIIWKDATEEEIELERKTHEDRLLKEQQLSNLLQQKKYVKALCLTIVMNQPFKALFIVKEILKSSNGHPDLQMALSKLRDDQIDSILKFAVAWNTNSKNCNAAQTVLQVLLCQLSADRLLKLPNIQTLVEGLLPYTERHHQRMSQLVHKVTFVDYVWQSMKPADDGNCDMMSDDDDAVKSNQSGIPSNSGARLSSDRTSEGSTTAAGDKNSTSVRRRKRSSQSEVELNTSFDNSIHSDTSFEQTSSGKKKQETVTRIVKKVKRTVA